MVHHELVGMDLKSYLLPLQRWWWLILIATIVAAIAGFFGVWQQPAIYTSRTTLMIGQAIANPNPSGAEFYLSQQLGQTYADIALREPVRQAAMQSLELNALPNYTTQVVPNTQLIEIVVTDQSPARAQAVANELANQLILLSPTGSGQEDQERQLFISQQLDDLERQIQQTQQDIQTKQTELGDLSGARQIADLQGQIATLQNKLATLQNNYASLLANSQAGAINTLTIIEPARMPTVPIGPNKPLVVATAAALGLLLAVGTAYLLEYLDDTVKTAEDVRRVVDLPALAGIAYIKSSSQNRFLIANQQPRAPVVEAFRALRTSIQFSSVEKPIRTLLVTSANPNEGKSLTAANLGTVMAQAGNRVLLIDSDLRRPVQHEVFALNREEGLTNLLLEWNINGDPAATEALFQRTLQPTLEHGLWLLSSGAIPPNPSELLGSNRLKQILDLLQGRFDFVIIDSPPIRPVTDAVVLSTKVDGVLLVADAGTTRRSHLFQATQQLRELNARLIGISLNRLRPGSDSYAYYYYPNNTYHTDISTPAKANGHPQKSLKQRITSK